MQTDGLGVKCRQGNFFQDLGNVIRFAFEGQAQVVLALRPLQLASQVVAQVLISPDGPVVSHHDDVAFPESSLGGG